MQTKTLVIYYSLEGNTRFVAEIIARTLEADILKLQPQKELSSRGFMKYFWGGKQVIMQEKPALLPPDKNPNDYAILIIGTPVWAFTFAPPLRSFLSTYKITGKKIALFCTHEGMKGNTLPHLKQYLPGNQFIAELDIKVPIHTNEKQIKKTVRDWAQGIKNVI